MSCPGVAPAAQPFLGALLHFLLLGRPVIVVTDNLKTQESVHQDIQTWRRLAAEGWPSGDAQPANTPARAGGGALYYPAWETLPHEERLPHADVISERLETLVSLAAWEKRDTQAEAQTRPSPLIVTSVAALLQKTFPAELLRLRIRQLKRGDNAEPLDLIEWLEDQGYEPEAQVNQKGELALRGGIVDVFPPNSPWPVRLEFFGSELESLRYFDPQTQLSREEVSAITLSPAGELGLLKRMVQDGALGGEVSEPVSAFQSPARSESAPALASFLDYLPREAVFLLCEPASLEEHAALYASQVPEGDPFFIPWNRFQCEAEQRGMVRVALGGGAAVDCGLRIADCGLGMVGGAATPGRAGPHIESGEIPSEAERAGRPLLFESLDVFRPLPERAPEAVVAEAQRRQFFSQLHRWLRQDYAVHVFCNNDGERQRFHEIWTEYGLDDTGAAPAAPRPSGTTSGEGTLTPPAAMAIGEEPGTGSDPVASPPELHTHLGALARGFLQPDARLVVVTDAEVFGRYKVQRPRRLSSPHAVAARSALDIDFTDLEEGDYVVHLQHGIGRYAGLKRMESSPSQKPGQRMAADTWAGQECLVIEYAPSDRDETPPRLYVPVTEAHLVSKYVGVGKARPPLNTLGGTRWAKAKAHAADAVRDLASELLSIQAARASQPGFPFPQDAPWQREFEGAFVYEETPDQVRAIRETKEDMEKARPMDRLICGDVGFGKTEVAIRAAFKAVLAGKQVALLAPTTVLAQQHFNTFRERMADYPVRVELLSRFRTPKAQRRVVADLAVGAVDIVIGTHRMVQPDVMFKDLGLVVIDEEQRFGVHHKEQLKQLRKLVDVLTLSATPIPRTLYLALTGARDMSTIETPPQDRLPVETIISPYDERVIRDAIQRELNRGGQVFFLHNRILDIDTVAARLRALVPDARIEIGHGQMHADDLEDVMGRFVNGQTDVLLSTTIIESGIDIPNANTIIIDRADRFGLSDLYQLRGRVGRYKHQAYAYLLLPRHAGLLDAARKRINAIKQFSTPGSGFKIAMRDLEIRGSGNLLGPEQSGHIAAVGFDLYCQLLKQSIGALQGQPVKVAPEVQVRFDFLDVNPGDETTGTPGPAKPQATGSRTRRASACLPLSYVAEPRQRIEIHRKLAQAPDKTALEGLRAELRDRFGPFPPAVEMLFLVADLKRLAGERGVTAIETREDKLMLTRRGDFIMPGGTFPRLARKEPKARINEIRRLLGSVG